MIKVFTNDFRCDMMKKATGLHIGLTLPFLKMYQVCEGNLMCSVSPRRRRLLNGQKFKCITACEEGLICNRSEKIMEFRPCIDIHNGKVKADCRWQS